MDIIILITSCIIILLIIFCSWNIIYDNYTDILNTHNLFTLNKSTREPLKYPVDSFISPIKTSLDNIETNLNTYKLRFIRPTKTFGERITTMKTLIDSVFPEGRKKLRLYSTNGLTRTVDTTHVLIFSTTATIRGFSISHALVNPNKFYITLNTNGTTFVQSLGNVRDRVASGGYFKIYKA
jgi:hypothetical protein